jgi:hypothetical protein
LKLRIKFRLISVIIILSILITLPLPSFANEISDNVITKNVEDNEENDKSDELPITEAPEEIYYTFEEVNNSVKDAIKSKDTELLKISLDMYSKLKKEYIKDLTNTENRLKVFTDMAELIDNLSNSEKKTKLKERTAVISIEMFEEYLIPEDSGVARKLILNLPQGNLRTELGTRFDKAGKDMVIKLIEEQSWTGGSFPSIWLENLPDEYFYDPDAGTRDKDNEYLIPKPDNNPNTPNIPNPEFDFSDGDTFKYIIERTTCYKITTDYMGYETRKEVTGFELGFCPFNSTGSGKGTDYGNYPGYYPGGTNTGNGHEYSGGNINEVVKKESGITLQYTLNKNEDSLYFYDTGIRLSEENTVTYDQIKDAMYQLAIRSEGSFVKDSDKFLVLLEGQIFVIKNTNQEIPMSEIENIFTDLNSEMRALDTRIGSNNSLTDYVEIKGLRNIVINNNPVTLEAKPLIENSRVMLPISQIAIMLGANVTVNEANTSTIVEYNNNTITFTVGETNVLVNGKTVEMEVPTKLNSNKVQFAQLQLILEYLNSEITWDSISSKLVINIKKAES